MSEGLVDTTFDPGADGTPDTSFPGAAGVTGTGITSGVYAIRPQADGRILIAGDSPAVDGVARNYVARICP